MLKQRAWSPWAVGAGIGVLSWFAFLTAKTGLGITTAFENTAALAGRTLSPGLIASTGYFASHAPKIDWEWTLVLGVFAGSLLSSARSGDRMRRTVPGRWHARFGGSVGKRLAWAFVGGAIMMVGARIAMGCTSGHGITGALQLAVSSWMFIVTAFAVAVATARTIYGSSDRSTGEGNPESGAAREVDRV